MCLRLCQVLHMNSRQPCEKGKLVKELFHTHISTGKIAIKRYSIIYFKIHIQILIMNLFFIIIQLHRFWVPLFGFDDIHAPNLLMLALNTQVLG